MAQFHWTVLGKTGKKYEVGLYHGDKSGHLMVHCNKKPIVVDFYIKESKDYAFFLDDELFDLSIEKKDGQFLYGLKSNTEADTPLNRAIKERDKKYLFKSGLVVLGTILLLIAMMVLVPAYFHSKSEANKTELLATKGILSSVKIKQEENGKFRYFFVAKGTPFSVRIEEMPNTIFPLEVEDEFMIEYVKGTPRTHNVLWNQPTKEQLKKYVKKTIEVHQQAHPEFSKEKIMCELDLAFKSDSLEGLAQFYFQITDAQKNSRFNRTTYQRFIREEPFRKNIEEKCWY